MGGFGKSIKKRLVEKEPHLVISLKENLPFSKGSYLSFLPQNLQEGIESETPFETQELIIKVKDNFLGVIAKGYQKEKLQKDIELYQLRIFEDDYLQSKPSKSFSDSVVINSNIASELNIFEGEEVTLIPSLSLLLPPSEVPPFTIVKVHSILDTETKNKISDKFFILYQKGNIRFKNFTQLQYGLEIKLKDPNSYPLYMNALTDYEVQNWVERNSSLFFALKLEKIIMSLLIILALIISFLGVTSILFLLITQKQKDMGILQAIGLSPKEITTVFTRLGFLLSSLGILLGLSLGFLVSLALKYNTFPLLPEMYQDRTLPTVITPINYLFIGIGSLILAWCVCYFPTRYLSRIPISHFLKSTER